MLSILCGDFLKYWVVVNESHIETRGMKIYHIKSCEKDKIENLEI